MTGVALAALVLGLFGSVHCVAMCGGLASVLSGGVAPDLRKRSATAPRWGVLAGFHGGRILTYALLGAIVGAVSLFAVEGPAFRTAQAVLRALSGALLVGVGLWLAGAFPAFATIERLGAPVWARLRPLASRLLPVAHPGQAVLLGAVWGFVPCGMVYTALALAATSGGPAHGALAMAAFGLGTTPALLSLGAMAERLARGLAARLSFRRAAGVLVATLGVMSVIAGVLALPATANAGGAAKAQATCHPVAR